MNVSPLHVWAIIRLLPNMQRSVVSRFRRRSDAEEYLRVLRRTVPDHEHSLVYYPPDKEVALVVRQECQKLVRDRVPEILTDQNINFAVEEMKQAEFARFLQKALIDKVQKISSASKADLLIELADLYELVETFLSTYDINRNEVLGCQMQRKIDRGTFERRLKLLWIEA